MRRQALLLGVILCLGTLPAAASTQAPGLAGAWKLDPAASDDLERRIGAAMAADTDPTFSAGFKSRGEGNTEGSRASAGAGRPTRPTPSDAAAAGPWMRMLQPPAELRIVQDDSTVTFTESGGAGQVLHLDGRVHRAPMQGGAGEMETTASWKDGRLTLERKLGAMGTVRTVLRVDPKKQVLVAETKVTSPRFRRPMEMKTVYQPAP